MSDHTQCGYCLGKNIRETGYEALEDLPNFSSYECMGCGAYTFDKFQPSPRATEVEMATGWHDNNEDSACCSPFAPYPQREAVAIHRHTAKWWLP